MGTPPDSNLPVYRIQPGYFVDRLYVAKSGDELAQIQQKSKGVRIYGEILGWLMEKVGLAVRIVFSDNRVSYIDKESMIGYLKDRIKNVPGSAAQTIADTRIKRAVNTMFTDHSVETVLKDFMDTI